MRLFCIFAIAIALSLSGVADSGAAASFRVGSRAKAAGSRVVKLAGKVRPRNWGNR